MLNSKSMVDGPIISGGGKLRTCAKHPVRGGFFCFSLNGR